MIEIQDLSRTCNETLILATLASGAHHGYQLALEIEERSQGAFRFQHGTLYPILHRLEREGLIRGDWIEDGSRRRRKSYRLTAEGGRELEAQITAWREFFGSFFQVVGGSER